MMKMYPKFADLKMARLGGYRTGSPTTAVFPALSKEKLINQVDLTCVKQVFGLASSTWMIKLGSKA